ncbi:GHMP kinase [Centipeda periodontii DSM 2778]|uniref:GHMP kinase n=1 Tax=Centipeda periodontii DSM 2778 TaxID=888060 RepID=F5RMG7_9FIRM|nr:GHMP kinase [Centipeda periodontii]EGK59858.1 GHMP kinase [Centipeda periodontii DSM 2778]
MEIIAKAPASCGELVEGVLDGTPFLVTAPISTYATATVSDQFTGIHGLGEKAEEAMKRTLSLIGRQNFPFGIRLESQIPRGKGMASSSADIAAVSYAVARAFGRELTGRELMDIAIAIEPSDGIAFAGLSHVSHTTGELFGQYRNVPLLAISIFDVGGTVDTIAYYKSKGNSGSQDAVYRQLLDTVDQAFRMQGQPQEVLLGQAATESARLNQKHLEKPHLDEFIASVQGKGALGTLVAHSGTVVGVLWASDMRAADVEQRTKELAAEFTEVYHYMQTARLISGGVICEIRS